MDANRDQFGAWLICRILGNTAGAFIPSRDHRATKTREPSSRAIRNQVLADEMEPLHAENYGVYRVREMHYLMRPKGWLVALDQVARIMKTLRITGVKSKKRSRQKPRRLIRIQSTRRKGLYCESPKPTLGGGHYVFGDIAKICVRGVCH